MELTPEQLEAYLDMLIDKSVDEFEGLGFRVKFSAAAALPAGNHYPEERAREPVKPLSQWENPNLWPGGTPPSFTKKDK